MSLCCRQLSLRHLFVWLAYFSLFVIGLTTVEAGTPPEAEPPDHISTQATFSSHPLNTPTNGSTLSTARPTFDWDDAGGTVISYTLLITGSGLFPEGTITTTESNYTPPQNLPNGEPAWTVPAHIGPEVSGYVSPDSVTVAEDSLIYLPLVFQPPPSDCPLSSSATFALIPLDGGPVKDHPDELHGDLNLLARGYTPTDQFKGLVDISGSTDANAPQLAGLFSPNSFPGIVNVYRVNSWDWGCGANGCPGPPLTIPDVTLIGLAATKGQPISIPERSVEIYGGGFKALVLYAAEKQITLKYTRKDSVVGGYSAHIENVCVDPNLIALYKAQVNGEGYHNTNFLPALRNNEVLGTALDGEIRVAIRDGAGSFLDPRSRKDWWRGY